MATSGWDYTNARQPAHADTSMKQNAWPIPVSLSGMPCPRHHASPVAFGNLAMSAQLQHLRCYQVFANRYLFGNVALCWHRNGEQGKLS
jgi:hypothetical protein